MARVKQTELAVLCVLGVQPMTGYAVRAAIREQLGFFWSESFGQIYPALAELERTGLVERHEGTRAGSSTYSLTSDGRARLVQLLKEPDAPAPRRDGLMLRLFFGRVLGPDACRELVERARDSARQQLAVYEGVRASVEAETTFPEHQAYWLITISAGEHTARAAIDWAEETLASLDGQRERYVR
ncbi:PadR family transcriptional regulator [Agromyces albus]|uniref:PadR family transcriptional regulator n=1 Tax=Agromyces albus TaxID=205332 RepID=A0A4Q2KS27_9MICO|nr:PadR family transcriptional regulator [Agromyces albus]RXZ68254.1 PadR family transcriptional regulator [Agromyces albus]